MYVHTANSGLGDAEKAKYTQTAASVAGTAVSVASMPAVHLLPAALAGPIGLAIGAAAIALIAIFSRKGPQQKVASTHIADEAEPVLKDNLAAYQSGARTRADQLAALANFDYAWQEVKARLNDPALGEPGQRGIRDRDRGGKWDWFAYYRDPIANDTPIADSSILSAVLPAQLAANPGAWLLPAALILVGVLL